MESGLGGVDVGGDGEGGNRRDHPIMSDFSMDQVHAEQMHLEPQQHPEQHQLDQQHQALEQQQLNSQQATLLLSPPQLQPQQNVVKNDETSGLISVRGEELISAAREDLISATGEDLISAAREDLISATGEDLISATGEDLISPTGEDMISATGEEPDQDEEDSRENLAEEVTRGDSESALPEENHGDTDIEETGEKQEPIVEVDPRNVQDMLVDPLEGIKEQVSQEDEDDFQNQNLIVPERRNCAGFEENIVLAVKECFFEDEIRCILIKKTKNGKKVKYFNRHCTNLAYNKKVCDICDKWFTNLSAGLPFTDIGGESIESFLDVKLDEDAKYNVKLEDNQPFIKQEVEQDMEEENEDVREDEDWEDEPIKPRSYKPKNIVYKSDVEKRKRRIPLELKVAGGWICKVPECGKVFAKRKGWLKHDLTHGAKQTCSYCGIAVSKLREHVKRKHPEALGDDVSIWSSGLSMEPRKAKMKTTSSAMKAQKEERIRKYSEDRDSSGNYVCRWDDCQGIFEKKKLYLKHIYLTHEGGTDKRKRKKICDICGNLITANNMKQHVRMVHINRNEKNFSCEHCGKEFKYRSELTVHLTHHTGEMNFTCTGCAKKFRRAAEARLCEKGHRGIFAFRCHMCDYKTNKKNHLDRHIESHLKATPFACPICGFKSGRKDNLKQHIEKRHCSANTTIKQLEDMYPDMYKMHETCEAAVIAKTEALAENFARMHDSEATPNTDEDKADVLAKQKPAVQREEKFNPALYEQNKYLHTDLATNPVMEHNLLHHAMQSNDISESMKYSIPEQVEQKYLPPDQQRLSEHERYFQEQRERMRTEQRDRVLIEQRERTERDRLLQEQREREHRERLLAEQRERERIMGEQRERERERMAIEMQERILQEHRERLGQNSLAEMYQRMRSLDQ